MLSSFQWCRIGIGIWFSSRIITILIKCMLEKVYYQWIFSFMLILSILNTYRDIHSLFHIRKSINLLECPNMFGISWISFQSHNKRKDFFNETQSYNARSTIKWTQNFSRNVTQQLVCGITPDLSLWRKMFPILVVAQKSCRSFL